MKLTIVGTQEFSDYSQDWSEIAKVYVSDADVKCFNCGNNIPAGERFVKVKEFPGGPGAKKPMCGCCAELDYGTV